MTPDGPGSWGHEDWPLLMSTLTWEDIHPLVKQHLRHVHIFPTRACVVNIYGDLCSSEGGKPWTACADPSCGRAAVTVAPGGDWVCGVHQCI